MPDPLFERLYGETAKMKWQPAESVRLRGQQRRTHQQIALGLGAFVAVLLLTGAAVAFAGRPGGPPVGPATPPPGTSTPATTPPVTPTPVPSTTAPSDGRSTLAAPPSTTTPTVPSGAFLRPSDAGTGTWQEQEAVGDWALEATLVRCAAAKAQPPAGGTPQHYHLERADQTGSVSQFIVPYGPGDATKAMASMRANVLACAQFSMEANWDITLRIVDNSFAGDESFMVETRNPERLFLNAFVRDGDLVTQIGVTPHEQARLKTMGTRAADRMCASVNSC